MHNWQKLVGRMYPKGWWVVLPTLVIVGLMLVFTDSTSASPVAQPRQLATEVLFQEQQPLCQTCHAEEYEAWKGTPHAMATLDPSFQEALAESSDQQYCLSCHTTGFDSGSGEFLAEGVTCEACHGVYQEGHPAEATMQLPMESETCHVCHNSTFAEWESSEHANQNIQCFDCHLAHEQGLRMDTEETLCTACHPGRKSGTAHISSDADSVECASCHMPSEGNVELVSSSMQAPVKNHTFQVSLDVCRGCHEETLHTTGMAAGTQRAAPVLNPMQRQQSQEIGALHQEVADLEDQVSRTRTAAVVSMGLTLALGGFLGLVAGVGGMTLWYRRSSHEESGK